MRVTRQSVTDAHAVARSYPDKPDCEYAMQIIAWLITAKTLRHPIYKGIGSAERIEKAITDALILPPVDATPQKKEA